MLPSVAFRKPLTLAYSKAALKGEKPAGSQNCGTGDDANRLSPLVAAAVDGGSRVLVTATRKLGVTLEDGL